MTRLVLEFTDPFWTPAVVTTQMRAWLTTRDELADAQAARDWVVENLKMEQRANLADEIIEAAVLSGSWRVEGED